MIDGGEADDKIIAVLDQDEIYDFNDIQDCPGFHVEFSGWSDYHPPVIFSRLWFYLFRFVFRQESFLVSFSQTLSDMIST